MDEIVTKDEEKDKILSLLTKEQLELYKTMISVYEKEHETKDKIIFITTEVSTNGK